MLTGQAKKDYQRGYMRKRRAKAGLLDPSVRPNVQPKGILGRIGTDPDAKYPELDADGQPIPRLT